MYCEHGNRPEDCDPCGIDYWSPHAVGDRRRAKADADELAFLTCAPCGYVATDEDDKIAHDTVCLAR